MIGIRGALERAIAALLVGSGAAAWVVVPAEAAEKVSAITVLASLPVASENRAGYSRDLFRHWTSNTPTGCDTRDQVLIDERVSGTVRGCTVVGGTWKSAYDGVTTTNPSTFDIDHVVPLAEAWDSGAWRWTASTREAFANDLGFAGSLIAVTASSNRSKSDQDPSEWMPARARCSYAKQWIAVKFRWRLSVNTAEKSALGKQLAKCPATMVLPARASITSDPTAGRPTSSGSSTSSSSSSAGTGGKTDPRFATCGAANDAGYGPYVKGQDAEYEWYIDRDSDGVVCEP